MENPVKKIKRKNLNLSSDFEKKARIVLLVLALLTVGAGFLAFGFLSIDDSPTVYGITYKTNYDIDGDGQEDRMYSGVNIALPGEFPEDYVYLTDDAEAMFFGSYSSGTMEIEYTTELSQSKLIKAYESDFDTILDTYEDDLGNLYIAGEKNIYTIVVVAMEQATKTKVNVTFKRED